MRVHVHVCLCVGEEEKKISRENEGTDRVIRDARKEATEIKRRLKRGKSCSNNHPVASVDDLCSRWTACRMTGSKTSRQAGRRVFLPSCLLWSLKLSSVHLLLLLPVFLSCCFSTFFFFLVEFEWQKQMSSDKQDLTLYFSSSSALSIYDRVSLHHTFKDNWEKKDDERERKRREERVVLQ